MARMKTGRRGKAGRYCVGEPPTPPEPGHTLTDAEKEMIDFLIDMAIVRWRESQGLPPEPVFGAAGVNSRPRGISPPKPGTPGTPET